MEYKEIIRINPEVRFGIPCIRKTRIWVYDILSWFVSGMTHEEIIEDYLELNELDIIVCLADAADRQNNTRVA